MNVPYHSARLEGKIACTLYRATLPLIVRRRISVERQLSFDVLSYSGERPCSNSRVYPIIPHLRRRPKRFTVVSDVLTRARALNCWKGSTAACVCKQQRLSAIWITRKSSVVSCESFYGKQLALIMSLRRTDRHFIPIRTFSFSRGKAASRLGADAVNLRFLSGRLSILGRRAPHPGYD